MAAGSSNGPPPSKHVFIHQLLKQQNNSKVRFLGCVVDYDDNTGQLTVQHDYPRGTDVESPKRTIVDINLTLNTTKLDVLQSGSWINIIGYVRRTSLPDTQQTRSGHTVAPQRQATVQAVLVWSAGVLRVEEYEKTLEDHLAAKATERRLSADTSKP